jgi:hypothetical protein
MSCPRRHRHHHHIIIIISPLYAELLTFITQVISDSDVCLRSAFFWHVTRCRVVIFTDISAHRIGSIFKDQVPKTSFLLGLLTLEDGTDTLSPKRR